MYERIDRELVGDRWFSTAGRALLEELVDGFGSRFQGSAEGRAAADFILERFKSLEADSDNVEELRRLNEDLYLSEGHEASQRAGSVGACRAETDRSRFRAPAPTAVKHCPEEGPNQKCLSPN